MADGTEDAVDPVGGIERTEALLLDELTERLDSLKLLRAGSDERADALLEQFGAKGKVEYQMLDQLAARAPLRFPDRFEEAHRTAMRAVEVFERNGARKPSALKAGFLTPLAAPVVQTLVRIIVRGYQKKVINRIRDLYARREASTIKGSAEFHMLRLARLQADRIAPRLVGGQTGLPAFLVGGAAISAVGSSLQGLLVSAAQNALILFVVAGAFFVLGLSAFWCILQAAGIARRRTRIALDQPLRALWETIGAAGNPPRDESRQFATYAIVLLLATWVVVPVAITFAFRLR